MKTLQEVANTAITGMLKQNCKSTIVEGVDECAYRGCNGTKCGVGFIITDEAYDRIPIEGIGVGSGEEVELALRESEAPTDPVSIMFYQSLQTIHDKYDVKDWACKLYILTEEFGLTMPVLNVEQGDNPCE